MLCSLLGKFRFSSKFTRFGDSALNFRETLAVSSILHVRARSEVGTGNALCLFRINPSIWSFRPLLNVQMRVDCREEAADFLIQMMQGVCQPGLDMCCQRAVTPDLPPKTLTQPSPHSFHAIQSHALVSSPLARWLSDKGPRDIQLEYNKKERTLFFTTIL